MTTPPAQPPDQEPSGWPPDPQSGWPAPGQVPPPGQYPPPPGYPPPPAYPPPGEYPGGSTAPYPGYPGQQGWYGGQPAYAAPGYPGYYPDPAAPFGYDQLGRPYSEKQKLVAGLLQILLGGFGVGRFYTGHVGIGVAQIFVTIFTCGIGAIWGLIDGILILVNGGTDSEGRPLRDS